MDVQPRKMSDLMKEIAFLALNLWILSRSCVAIRGFDG